MNELVKNSYMKRKRARTQSVGVKIRNVVQELREKDSEEERQKEERKAKRKKALTHLIIIRFVQRSNV